MKKRTLLISLILLVSNTWALSEHSLSLIKELHGEPLSEEQINHLDEQLSVLNLRNNNSWCSPQKNELLLLLSELNKPKICLEIGVFLGASLMPIMHTMKHQYSGHVYAIDSWSTNDVLNEVPESDPNYIWWKNLDLKMIKTKFGIMLENYEYTGFTTILHQKSSTCINLVPNEVDFIHFHGNMGKEASLEDAILYLPKVKSNGYILFSDIFCVIDGKHTKMEALWYLLDHCDVVYEIENSNAILLKKR